MKKKAIWIILVIAVLGGILYFVLKKPKEDVEIEDEDQDQKIEEVQEKEESKSKEKVTDYKYTGDTDFSSFSIETQSVGELTEEEFSIQGVEQSKEDGFHRIVFTLKQKGGEEEDSVGPFVTASYLSNLGVLRLDFQKISADSTGIGYQQEKRIDKDGVLRIYHNISAQADQEIYDIGVVSSTPFKLTSEYVKDGVWEVLFEVKYPGELAIDMDLGSEEFSREDQAIEGVGLKEGASITAYTYGRPSGLLKLVWVVTATGNNPIPSVKALFNNDGDLVVVFEELQLDRVVGSISGSVALSSGITLTAERTGDFSTYVFSNVPSDAQYKLSASLSPNQVSLEIK